MSYHTESEVYSSYLEILKGIYKKDIHKMQDIYSTVAKAIPRHYGSYYAKANMVPLNIQGGRYRLFGNLQLKPEIIKPYYSETEHNDINYTLICMSLIVESWHCLTKTRRTCCSVDLLDN